MEPVYEVVWPLGKWIHHPIEMAKRAADLEGKTICELWEWLFRGDEIFPILRELLAKRYPGISIVPYTVFGNTHGRNEKEVIAALPQLLREHGCDAVVSGVGG